MTHVFSRAGSTIFMLVMAYVLLAGCGAMQSAKEASRDAARAIFVARVKTMHLVFEGRGELNRDERGASLPVALRVYQLKDAKAFEAATYAQLLDAADSAMKADILNRHDRVLGPESILKLDAPMANDARYVGIVAFFRDPSTPGWRMVLPISQWKQTDPVTVSVIGDTMALEP